jgi:hypothetical protein
MPRRPSRVQEDLPKYYDRHGVLREIEEGRVEFALDDELRRAILKGERARRLQNLSIKLDAAQIHGSPRGSAGNSAWATRSTRISSGQQPKTGVTP